MSSGQVRKVSRQDIQLVQNLIERCLQLYMSQKEVVDTLLAQAKIEPDFTQLDREWMATALVVLCLVHPPRSPDAKIVWQKLEEENQDFFKAYHLRLMVKDQILEFNKLLKRQVDIMCQPSLTGVASMSMSNGSHLIPPMYQNPALYAPNTGPVLKPDNMHQPITASLPNSFTNCRSSFSSCVRPTVDMSAHAKRIDVSPNMLLAQNNMGLVQGINGGMIRAEPGYAGNSQYMFGADGNVIETHAAIGDAPVSSFSSVESNAQTLSETLLDPDTSAFGFLDQILPNFSLSDLTAGFSNCSDILESYTRSPFLATDANNSFLDPHCRGEHQGENKRLDTISEGLSYKDFGSD